MSILARAQPDLFAFETIPSQKEAEALTQLLREFPNMKAWMSFNCQVCIYPDVRGKVNIFQTGRNSSQPFFWKKNEDEGHGSDYSLID